MLLCTRIKGMFRVERQRFLDAMEVRFADDELTERTE